MKKPKTVNPNKVGFGKLLLWNSRQISTSVFVLLCGYLLMYCTDVLHVKATTVSLILVASKLVDGVTDTVAGFIVDKTKTKWGKGRPYEVFIVGLWLCSWLMFSCPESLSMPLKYIYIFLMYAMSNAVCYTFLNANNLPYVVRAFTEGQIVGLTSYGSVITMLGAVVFNVVFPGLIDSMGNSPAGWSRTIGMLSILMAALGLLRMLTIPEKYDVEATAAKKSEDLKPKDIVTMFRNNKYLVIICVMGLVFNFVCNMGVTSYYYKYVVGNLTLAGLASLVSMVSIPLAFLFPQMLKKINVGALMMAGFVVSAVGYLVNFIAVDNVPLLLVGAVLTGAGTVPASMLVALALMECADYNEWKQMPRMESSMSSLNGLMCKVGAAVGTGLLGIMLDMSGFDAAAAEATGALAGSATLMIRMLFSIVPMVLYALTALTLLGYRKLAKELPEIRKDNEERRAAVKAETAPETAE